MPSAIINTLNSGEITDSLSGIYINNLVGSQISASNTTPQFDFFNNGFSTPIGDYVNKATLFWNTLGFSNQLLDSYNTGTLNLPYIYLAENSVVSNILRNQAEVDISANGSNPLKSYCSLWAPPLQYSIICESNQKFGDKRPQYATTPFYLIGSSFPSKQYYGGKGTKLPVMGVETKIYNNDYTIPQNLDSNSSVIYVIERNNYYPSPTVQQLQAIEEEDEKEAAPINYTPSMFEYQGNLNYEAPLYLIDSDDEDLE